MYLVAQKRREYRKPTYVAYVDLKAAFDSVYRPSIWNLLRAIGIPDKIISLITQLYSDTVSYVSVGGNLGEPFVTMSGVRQGCILAPDLFDLCMDWVMERTVHRAMFGVSVGKESFTDLDFADDVGLLSELVDLLQSALVILQEEGSPLGLQINWKKTKIQSLCDYIPRPLDLVDLHLTLARQKCRF